MGTHSGPATPVASDTLASVAPSGSEGEDHRSVVAHRAAVEEVASHPNLCRVLCKREGGKHRSHSVSPARRAANIACHAPECHVRLVRLGPAFDVLVEEVRQRLVRHRRPSVAVIPRLAAGNKTEPPPEET